MKSGGGGLTTDLFQEQSEAVAEEALTDIVGILLSNKGKKFEGKTDTARTLMARDYKGFGNQTATGVLEWKK